MECRIVSCVNVPFLINFMYCLFAFWFSFGLKYFYTAYCPLFPHHSNLTCIKVEVIRIIFGVPNDSL